MSKCHRNALKDKPKTKGLFEHTSKRFLERFGIKYTEEIRNDLIQKIQSGQHLSARKRTNRVTKFNIDYENLILTVLYDSYRKEIITVY